MKKTDVSCSMFFNTNLIIAITIGLTLLVLKIKNLLIMTWLKILVTTIVSFISLTALDLIILIIGGIIIAASIRRKEKKK